MPERRSPHGAPQAAHDIYEYLALRDGDHSSADIVIGFGHFDKRIAHRCADVFHDGCAPRILFTGGRGAGTADIAASEARFLRDQALRHRPGLDPAAILTECGSTNTSGNMLLSAQLLARLDPPLRFGHEIRRALIVATPYRQRRVWLTCRKIAPAVDFVNSPPASTFTADARMMASKGLDLIQGLRGEIERLERYARLGYIEADTIPGHIRRAAGVLDGN